MILRSVPAATQPARAVGGRIEERVAFAREGGRRRPVAGDVGERGRPNYRPSESESAVLRLVRPPIDIWSGRSLLGCAI